MNRFIFGNLLYFNRTILCILTVRAVQLCKIQRDFLRICTLYVELCRYFCADVARRRGTRFVRSCWKRKNAGAASPRGGAKGWLVCAGRFTGKARRLVGGRAMAAPACAVRMGGVPDAPGTSARLRAHMECAPTVWRASTLLYIHIKNTPPGSVGLRAGRLGGLFTSDQTHKAGQTKGERRDIGNCQ